MRRAKKDQEVALKRVRAGYRQRAVLGKANAEVRISPSEYHPVVNRVLENGFTIWIAPGQTPDIRKLAPVPRPAWGFDAETLRRDGVRIGWPDKEILFFLRWDFFDYSAETPQ